MPAGTSQKGGGAAAAGAAAVMTAANADGEPDGDPDEWPALSLRYQVATPIPAHRLGALTLSPHSHYLELMCADTSQSISPRGLLQTGGKANSDSSGTPGTLLRLRLSWTSTAGTQLIP